ncbi:hypothetical protein [Moheibacter lacus]|uniref:Lipoprotein n=1 Tax=Moheibacter lacus TaxID=2745851 RepID=A0A838ZR78_9FLAO|nr:hypothetical protein [Moheibacter lacus]MBA5628663.1 hypothetical protein [Moheibacter lacus]
MKNFNYSKAEFRIKAFTKLIIGGFILTVFFSCGTNFTPINYGNITTPGVEITADDGSFYLTSENSWSPPFQSTVSGVDDMEDINNRITSQYDFAMRFNAKKVKVKTPYLNKELFGVLMLNPAIDGCENTATRSYQIAIPEEYVHQALNGQVSVLYEYYDCGKLNAKTWILWLSDVPF